VPTPLAQQLQRKMRKVVSGAEAFLKRIPPRFKWAILRERIPVTSI
jgi:hypothetical protein